MYRRTLEEVTHKSHELPPPPPYNDDSTVYKCLNKTHSAMQLCTELGEINGSDK